MDKGFYKKSEYVHLWIHLLLKVNHEAREFLWNGQMIALKPGQFLSGRKELSHETGIAETTVERILTMLENGQQIEQQKTTKFRLITVLKWKEYQDSGQQNGQQADNKRTTGGQQTDTNKNVRIKELKKYSEVPLEEQLKNHGGEFAKGVLTDFSLYWTQPDPKGRERWQLEKTWDVHKRLLQWVRRDEKREYERSQKNIKVEEKPVHREPVPERTDGGFNGLKDLLKRDYE